MIRAATSASENNTRVRAFAFTPLRWAYLKDGQAWRCRELFAFIALLAKNAARDGNTRVAVITYYDRVCAALLAFLAAVKQQRESARANVPSVEVLTPEEASGRNIDAVIVLGGHRRTATDERWHGDHQHFGTKVTCEIARHDARCKVARDNRRDCSNAFSCFTKNNAKIGHFLSFF